MHRSVRIVSRIPATFARPSAETLACLPIPTLISHSLLRAAAHPTKPLGLYLNSRIVTPRTYSTTANAEAHDCPDDLPPSGSIPDLDHLARLVERTEAMFIAQVDIPTEAMTLHALKSLYTVAKALTPRTGRTQPVNPQQSLLDVDVKAGAIQLQSQTPTQLRGMTAQRVSQAAFTITSAPNVAVTKAIVNLYVDIHAELNIAHTVAEVLAMYISKPLPRKSGNNIIYKKRFKYRPGAVMDLDIAEHALQVALYAKDLDAAINIVDVCYCQPGHYFRKIYSSLMLPGLFLGIVPPAAYAMAKQFAEYNNMIDPGMATGFTFAGIMAYVVFTGSIGLLSNMSNIDHMIRVTWIPGTAYRTRWFREEEREALDKIAMTWGFQEAWKHGEETGPEWEALKEWIGLRGMLLDRVEFMEHMS